MSEKLTRHQTVKLTDNENKEFKILLIRRGKSVQDFLREKIQEEIKSEGKE